MVKIDVSVHKDTGKKRLKLVGVPTVVGFKNGTETGRKAGLAQEKDIDALF